MTDLLRKSQVLDWLYSQVDPDEHLCILETFLQHQFISMKLLSHIDINMELKNDHCLFKALEFYSSTPDCIALPHLFRKIQTYVNKHLHKIHEKSLVFILYCFTKITKNRLAKDLFETLDGRLFSLLLQTV
jgi:hypothetical protein